MPSGLITPDHFPLLERLSTALILGALVLSYVVVYRIDGHDSSFPDLRKRFVLGIPWGTVLVILFLYGIYHAVQGAGDPGGPNVIGFRSWSLWYPQGIFLSSFAHASESHLVGNVLGTAVFGALVEYTWSHYPTETGQQTFSSWRTNPFVRIGVVVAGIAAVGIAGALFVPGAVIGFSGVVFALAGFAIVARPLSAAGGMLGLQVVDLVYSGLTNPIGLAEADTRFVSPWWADTALQGHLFGMVLGVLFAVLLFRYRRVSPRLRYVWFAALVFAVTRSMWTIFWFLSETEFVLFRGLGAASVLVLASVVAIAAFPGDRSVVPGLVDVPLRTVGVSVLIGLVIIVAFAGVPYNLVDVSPGEEIENGIEVDGYTVTYAEDVEDQYTSIDLPVVGELLSVESSGVIVTSDERNIWALQTPADELAFEGYAVAVVGDLTTREVVVLNHTQWTLAGGNTTYKVYGQHWQVMDEQRLLFASPPARAGPVINGTTFGIAPSAEFYDIAVLRDNETVERTPVPPHNESVTLRGVTFTRDEDRLVATHQNTTLRFAEYRIEREE